MSALQVVPAPVSSQSKTQPSAVDLKKVTQVADGSNPLSAALPGLIAPLEWEACSVDIDTGAVEEGGRGKFRIVRAKVDAFATLTPEGKDQPEYGYIVFKFKEGAHQVGDDVDVDARAFDRESFEYAALINDPQSIPAPRDESPNVADSLDPIYGVELLTDGVPYEDRAAIVQYFNGGELEPEIYKFKILDTDSEGAEVDRPANVVFSSEGNPVYDLMQATEVTRESFNKELGDWGTYSEQALSNARYVLFEQEHPVAQREDRDFADVISPADIGEDGIVALIPGDPAVGDPGQLVVWNFEETGIEPISRFSVPLNEIGIDNRDLGNSCHELTAFDVVFHEPDGSFEAKLALTTYDPNWNEAKVTILHLLQDGEDVCVTKLISLSLDRLDDVPLDFARVEFVAEVDAEKRADGATVVFERTSLDDATPTYFITQFPEEGVPQVRMMESPFNFKRQNPDEDYATQIECSPNGRYIVLYTSAASYNENRDPAQTVASELQAYVIDTQRVQWPEDGSVFIPRSFDPSTDENRPTNADHNGVSWVQTILPAGVEVDPDVVFPTVDNDGKVYYAGKQILDAQDPCGEGYKEPVPAVN